MEKNKKSKKIIRNLITAILFLGMLLGGLLSCSGSGGSSSSANSNIPIDENDIVLGNPDGKVTVVEFVDLQCPACASFNEAIFSRVWRIISQDTRWVFKNFPLRSIHPYAQLAAEYSTAAHLQGKYVEYHDLIFQRQSEWSNLSSEGQVEEKFIEYATALGLDIEKLKTDAASRSVKEKIQLDVELGDRIGVNSTPSVFLNGEKIPLPRSAEDFYKQIIDLAK